MKPKKIGIAVFVLGLLGYLSIFFYDEFMYRKYIPAHIKVSRLIKEEIEGFREYYGGVIFTLSPSTLEKVKAQGATFLNADLHSRGSKENSTPLLTYTKWRQAPCFIESLALKTILRGNDDLYNGIMSKAAADSALCTSTSDNGVNLVIIPDLGIIIWTFVD